MSSSEEERQAIESKRRCFGILKESAERIVAEGLVEQIDDALVDFVGTARFIDKRIGSDETLKRIGSIINNRDSR